MDGKDSNLQKLAEEYRAEALKAYDEREMGKTAELLQDAIHLFQVLGDDDAYTRCLNLLGVVYANIGDETRAVDCYLEGLERAKDKELYRNMASFYNNIGSRYQELGQHKKAIFYFEMAVESQDKETEALEDRDWFVRFIVHLNLAMSNHKLGDMDAAGEYLEKVEQLMADHETGRMWKNFRLPVLTLKSSIYWEQGKKDFVNGHLNEMLDLSKELDVASDYVQNVRELAELFKKMENYECWKTLLSYVDEMACQQNTVFYHLVSIEMCMEYYHTMGETDKYSILCVKYAQLYQKQKEIEDKERIKALDIRIALKEKEEQRRIAEAKSKRDELTGLGSRYALEKDIKEMVQDAAVRGRLIAVGILDIDCFKQVNDTYGHNEGDKCLQRMGEILKNAAEGFGRVYRFGGDEFVVLIPEGDYEAAERVGERIKVKLAAARIENKNSAVSNILTVSQGYACFRPREGERLAGLLEHADKALYKVKENGRNSYRIILEEL